MKPWLKKITSVVSVAALSSSMIAANLTVAVAEEGDLGDIDGDPIVSITHLSAKAQEDAMKAEEESLNTITGGETVTVIIELETPGVIEAGYTPGTAEAAAYANGLKADQAAKNAQIESLGAQTVEIENKINGTAEPADRGHAGGYQNPEGAGSRREGFSGKGGYPQKDHRKAACPDQIPVGLPQEGDTDPERRMAGTEGVCGQAGNPATAPGQCRIEILM